MSSSENLSSSQTCPLIAECLAAQAKWKRHRPLDEFITITCPGIPIDPEDEETAFRKCSGYTIYHFRYGRKPVALQGGKCILG